MVVQRRKVATDGVVQYWADLGVHRDTVVAAVIRPSGRGKREVETRTFPTDTKGLLTLGGWLVEQGVTRVGMESTGVYWKPIFYLLEDRVPEVWLLNAVHLKNVPGRKTDVGDAKWIAQLVEHGLVRRHLSRRLRSASFETSPGIVGP
ncbi:transposase [Cryobacterium sp. TMT2-14]|uniref:IS110 family transposase n=1 Tax=Cryobacterium sp. TMT2-14 TaxID=1259245 RepID=UPI0018E0B44D|nr:transposase [Cryobacterium sp. TMT2-14]